MKNKNGISLITLIITIVVVIILAAAVILTLTKNNSASDAKVANLLQSKANIEASINLKVTKEISTAKNESVKQILTEKIETEIIDGPDTILVDQNDLQLELYKLSKHDVKEKIGLEIKDNLNWYMNSIGKIYLVYDYIENVPKYMIDSGKVKDSIAPFIIILNTEIEDEPVVPEEPEEPEDENAITAPKVKENPQLYYGKKVNYLDKQNFNNWKLFYADNNNIYLMAGDYVPSSMYNTSVFSLGTHNSSTAYCVKSTTSRTDLIDKVLTPTNFEKLRDTQDTAANIMGGPTIEQVARSYNAIQHPDSEVSQICYSGNNTSGYNVKANEAPSATDYHFFGINKEESLYSITNTKNAFCYCVASASAVNANSILNIGYDGHLYYASYTTEYVALRPVVCLKKGAKLQLNNDGESFDIIYDNSNESSQMVTLTFDANGGTVSTNTITQLIDSPLTLPTPTISGAYKFVGWYTQKDGGELVNYKTMPSTSTTLYARWEEAELVTLTFDANGGSVTTSTIKQEPNTELTLPTPTRSGYTFDGWYTALSGGTKVTYTKMPSASKTLYARWTSVWTGTKATGFARGSGTSSDPYIIETAAQLAYFQSQVNDNKVTYSGKYIEMVNNIDLNNKTWVAIGKGSSAGITIGSTYVFSGKFDGCGNSIYNLKTNNENQYVGFFGNASYATIKNLTIQTGSIYIPEDNSSAYSGAILAFGKQIVIDNCINKIEVVGEGGRCGGIVGYIDGSESTTSITITNCKNYGKIDGYGNGTGGIVGYSSEVLNISNCFNYGRVSSSSDYNNAGGIVGYQTSYQLKMSKCGNQGSILAKSNAGGLVGDINTNDSHTISQCYNTGEVHAYTNYSGGILGGVGTADTKIEYCYNLGNIKASTNYAAGIASNAGTIKNCYSVGTITAPKYSCGIASAYTSSYSYINNYYLSGSATYAIYNKSSASGYMSKSSSQLKASSMVTTLNNGSTVYKAVSGGYPVFTWQ